MIDNWYIGNANDDAPQHRGWLLGHFVEPESGAARVTPDVEVKWSVHPALRRRPSWTTAEARTTLLLLVDGRFRLDLSVGSVILARRGDYAVWGPGIDHSWQAVEPSTVITIRWPSSPS